MRFWSAAASSQSSNEDENGRRGKARIAVTTFIDTGNAYIPPAWISSTHDLVFAQRVTGKAGLTIWERSDVLLEGVRGLARAVDAIDPRIRIPPLEEVAIAREVGGGLEDVAEGEEDEEHGMQMDVESPDTIVAVDMS